MAKRTRRTKISSQKRPKNACRPAAGQAVYDRLMHNLQGHKTLLELQQMLVCEQEALVTELKPETGK